jgi:hypothetical protein
MFHSPLHGLPEGQRLHQPFFLPVVVHAGEVMIRSADSSGDGRCAASPRSAITTAACRATPAWPLMTHTRFR